MSSIVLEEIEKIFSDKKEEIRKRLDGFKLLWKSGSEEDIFAELVFCLLTPQSKARICWTAVENLQKKGLLLKGNKEQILQELKGIRFKNKKALYIIESQNKFLINNKLSIKSILSQFRNVFTLREWLVKNLKGIGYKEASHFLRNIGLNENIAILDRHILKNLKLLKLIDEIPPSLSKKKYLEIEKKLRKFAREIKIPMGYLDLILWYKETGNMFK